MHQKDPTELHGFAEEQHVETSQESIKQRKELPLAGGKLVRKKLQQKHEHAHIAHSAPVLGGGPPEVGPSGPSGHILDFIGIFIWAKNP